jgi:hypothetical protein
MYFVLAILRYSARRVRASLPRFGFVSGVVLVVLAMLLPSTASAVDSPTVWTQVDYPSTGDPLAGGMSCASSYSGTTGQTAVSSGMQVLTLCNFPVGDRWYDGLNTANPSAPVSTGMVGLNGFCMLSIGGTRFAFGSSCYNNAWNRATAEVTKGVVQGLADRQVLIKLTITGTSNTSGGRSIDITNSVGYGMFPSGGTVNNQSFGGLNLKNSPHNVWIMTNTEVGTLFPNSLYPVSLKSFGNLAPADECSGLTLTIADDTEPFLSGDTMSIEVNNAPGNPVASVEIQMSSDRAWQGVMAGQIGQVQTHTVPVLPGGTVEALSVVFRCVRSDGSIGYITYGDGVVASDPNARPCHLARVSWPSASAVADIQPGDTFSVIVDMTGPWSADPLLEVESVDAVWSNLGPNTATTDATVIESGPLAPGTRHTLDITVPAEFLPGTDKVGWSLELRCTDSEGSLTGYSSWAPRMLADILSGANVSCYSSVGIKLAPSSWVPGLLRGVVCAFSPDGDNIGALLSSASDAVEDKPPFIFIYAALDFGDSVVSGFNGSADSACFDAGPLVPASVAADADVCIGDGVDPSSSQRSLMALLLVGPMWLGFVSHAVSLVREK